jgi:hypothetical protein
MDFQENLLNSQMTDKDRLATLNLVKNGDGTWERHSIN